MQLKPYQQNGIKWLIKQENTFGSGILADDMGMGKTIQLCGLINARPLEKTLLIVPKIITRQWLDILGDKVIVYRNAKSISSKPITLVTHGVMTYLNSNSPILNTLWDRVILDEGHILCNSSSWQSRNIRKLNAIHKWIVTGTPCIRSPNDLRKYKTFLGLARKVSAIQILKHYILRRRASDLKSEMELPSLNIDYVNLPFDNHIERDKYDEIMKKLILLTENKNKSTLESIIRLEQLSILPETIKMSNDLEDVIYHLSNDIIKLSGGTKLNYLLNDIKTKNQPCIIFSRFINEIKWLSYKLKEQKFSVQMVDGQNTYKGIEKKYIPHMIKQILRHNNMSEFYKPCIWSFLKPAQIMIAQIRCAGVGLNLQHYRNVYLTMPMWNASYEKQAISRVHRIGQKHSVNVQILMLHDYKKEFVTIDEQIEARQKIKLQNIENFFLVDTENFFPFA